MTVTEVVEGSAGAPGCELSQPENINDIVTDPGEDRKWGLSLMRSGDRSFYNYDKDLIMCGARDQISGHHIILRTPLPWQGIRHTDNTHTRVSYSEYFSRVSGPPEMQTCLIIFTSAQWSP